MEPENLRVLIVDDSSNMRRMIRNALQQLGFKNMEEAEDGGRALSLMKQNQYGCVLLDWNMPVMSGIELLRFMRVDISLKNIPVIMLTAEADKKNVMEALGAGVTEYVLKPFNVDTLKKKIDSVLSR